MYLIAKYIINWAEVLPELHRRTGMSYREHYVRHVIKGRAKSGVLEPILKDMGLMGKELDV